MNAPTFAAATLVALSCGVLPAKAADPQLMNLVMPDAKVMAGVNVAQARTTPFGQYVLSQIAPQDQEIQKLVALVGFDPRRDVVELLVASNGLPPGKSHSGLVMATGTFDPGKVAATAQTAGAKSEIYKEVTILEDPQQTSGVAFPTGSLAIMGDVANVKAAIDRLSAASVLPAALLTQVNQWSLSQDAWVVSIAPPSSLTPPATAPQVPGLTQQNAFQAIQQVAGGVKFGSTVTFTAQAQADTAANATSMVGVLQLLSNLAQMQASQNPQAAAAVKSLVVSSTGNTVNVTLSLPGDQFQQLVHPARPATVQRQRRVVKQM